MSDDKGIKAWRIAEAVLFSSPDPLDEETLGRYLLGRDVGEVLEELRQNLEGHGIRLARADNKWYLRTADDLAAGLALKRDKKIRLSNSALESLAAIAYLQPITRTEIEGVRGRKLSATVLETLMKLGWIAPKGRKRGPGRAMTWGTTDDFLRHFSLPDTDSLPKGEDLKNLKKTEGGIFFQGSQREQEENGEQEQQPEQREESEQDE